MVGEPISAPLPALLRRLEAVLAERRVPVVERLVPGAAASRVRQALGSLKPAPPEDVSVWFAWHDGIAWRGDERLGHAYLVTWIPCSTEEAVAECSHQPVGLEPWEWHPDWLPIGHMRNPDRLAMNFGSDPDERGLVQVVSGTGRQVLDVAP